jgi:hypothetical protein
MSFIDYSCTLWEAPEKYFLNPKDTRAIAARMKILNMIATHKQE